MNANSLRPYRVLPALVVVLALLVSGIAMAGAPDGGSDQSQAGPSSPAAPDGSEDGGGVEVLDVGAEYSSADAPPWGAGGSDLPYTTDSAWHFYSAMRSAGYTGPHSFIWGNNNAWETDWKKSSLGGDENNWVDNVDIMFFHDHGGDGSIWFPWGGNYASQNLFANECSGSWGDRDVEWIGLDNCLTLNDVVGYASCMNGAHLIAGFKTVSWGSDWGTDWTDQLLGWYFWPFGWLRSPKTITQSWFTVCDASQPAGTVARVIAEDWRHFDDKVWNRGGPVYGDIVNWPKYYRDHSCYKPPARQVDVDALSAAAVNRYVVEPRNVNQDYAQGIANSLGLEGTAQCPAGGTECGLVASQGGQTLTLSISTASGGFVLQNTSQLWAAQDPAKPLTLPTADAATRLAGNYLDGHQALPGSSNVDKATAHYAQDTQTEFTVQQSGPGAAMKILDTQGTDVLVAYGRTLTTGVQAASGAAIDVGSVGPGSATKLYYGAATTALRSPTQEQLPIGLLGGSRDVHGEGTITTQDYLKSWDAFLADPQLAVVSIPLDWNTAVRKAQTFSYYEQPSSVPQQELIPVWVFTADLYNGANLVGPDATIYVPASDDYYPPEVTIDSPAKCSTILPGTEVDLLSTASGGYAPFTFEWSTSKQGVVGEPTEDTKFVLDENLKPGDPPSPTTISLIVTNANGQSRTASVVVNALCSWLPLTLK